MRLVREAAAPYQTPIEAQPFEARSGKASFESTAQERGAFCGLETHWFPRTVRLNGHEVDGSPELVGEDGKGFGLSMFFSELFDEFLCGWIVPQEENGGFGESPLQVNVPDLGSAGSESFPRRALLAFHQSSVGGEVLDPFEALDLVNLVEHGHGENLSDSGNGTKPEEVLRVMDFGFLGEEKLEVLDEKVVVAGELD